MCLAIVAQPWTACIPIMFSNVHKTEINSFTYENDLHYVTKALLEESERVLACRV